MTTGDHEFGLDIDIQDMMALYEVALWVLHDESLWRHLCSVMERHGHSGRYVRTDLEIAVTKMRPLIVEIQAQIKAQMD